MNRSSEAERSRIELEAAEWLVRSEGGLDAAGRSALAEWCARSPHHAASLARARLSWATLGQLAGQAETLLQPPQRHPTRRMAAGVVASAALAAVTAPWWANLPAMGGPQIRSARGEVRDVTLSDGSGVTLAPATVVVPQYGTAVRQVALLAGEALFAPAPVRGVETRPFIVTAGPGQVRALGTRFVVSLRGTGADVTVLEHAVQVSAGSAQAVLQPAQHVHYGADGLQRTRRVDAERSTDWLRGRLTFDSLPLADVVAVLNRYRDRPVLVVGPALRARRVSGTFHTEALDDMLQTVAETTGARVLDLPLPFDAGRTLLY